MTSKTQPAQKPRKGKLLVALVGALAACGLLVSTPAEESGRVQRAEVTAAGDVVTTHVSGPEHRTAYRDIVGIWTICDGDTADVKAGQVETRAGCQARLERQLLAHAEPVMACIPQLAAPGLDYKRWAAISLAYNVGVTAVCKSTMAQHFRAGRWRQGCDAILLWNRAGGRVVRGLTLRRERERAICLRTA